MMIGRMRNFGYLKKLTLRKFLKDSTEHMQVTSSTQPSSVLQKSSIVGNLMYVMISTTLDIAHTIRVVSQFLSNPIKEHWL